MHLLRSNIPKFQGVNDPTEIVSKYKWKLNNVDIVELCYGLKSINAVEQLDGRPVNVENLVRDLSCYFNIEVSDPYRTFYDIQNRKCTAINGSRTRLLDKMTRTLNDVIHNKDR